MYEYDVLHHSFFFSFLMELKPNEGTTLKATRIEEQIQFLINLLSTILVSCSHSQKGKQNKFERSRHTIYTFSYPDNSSQNILSTSNGS
jgi:hypothetical protein